MRSQSLVPQNETPKSLADRICGALAWVPEFPRAGFRFPDITPILEKDPELFREVIRALLEMVSHLEFDTVLCVESFGYVFGVPVALERGCKIALLRKAGKLPREHISCQYSMCYDHKREMEMHIDAIAPGARVLIVDDFLVSGGTICSALTLIRRSEGAPIGVACVIEAPTWHARSTLAPFDVPIFSLATIVI